MIYTRTNKRGFTLVETLIYIAGVVALLVVISSFLVYMYRWYQNATIGPRVDHVGITLVDTITKAIRGGGSINTAQSSFDVSSGALSVTGTVNLVDTTQRFTLSGGRVSYVKDSDPTTYITPSNITVSRLQFKSLSSPISSAVKFDVDISFVEAGSTSTRTYNGFAILKQSYE